MAKLKNNGKLMVRQAHQPLLIIVGIRPEGLLADLEHVERHHPTIRWFLSPSKEAA